MHKKPNSPKNVPQDFQGDATILSSKKSPFNVKAKQNESEVNLKTLFDNDSSVRLKTPSNVLITPQVLLPPRRCHHSIKNCEHRCPHLRQEECQNEGQKN